MQHHNFMRHGPGKHVALTCMRNPVFCEQAKVFINHDMSKDSIISAWEIAVVSLYNGLDDEQNESTNVQVILWKKYSQCRVSNYSSNICCCEIP